MHLNRNHYKRLHSHFMHEQLLIYLSFLNLIQMSRILVSTKILSSKTVFNIDEKCVLSSNQHFRMISVVKQQQIYKRF